MTFSVFSSELSLLDRRVFVNLVKKYEVAYQQAQQGAALGFISESIRDCLKSSNREISHNEQFKKRMRLAKVKEDVGELLLEYAQQLGANKKQIKQDQKALNRYLDAEALNDRFARNVGNLERELIFLLDRLPVALNVEDSADHARLWAQLGANELLETLLVYKGDARVRIAAIDCIGNVFNISAGNGDLRPNPSLILIQLLFRIAQTVKHEPELQMAAFSALAKVSPNEFSNLVKSKLNSIAQQPGSDDLFVRAEIARALCQHYAQIPDAPSLIQQLAIDSSDFVRQELVKESCSMPYHEALNLLIDMLRVDEVDKVQASAVFELCGFEYNAIEDVFRVGAFLADLLSHSNSELVIRAILDVAPRIAAKLSTMSNAEQNLQRWYECLEPVLSETHISTTNLKIRRWASSSREALWVQCHIRIREQYLALKAHAQAIKPSRSKKIRDIGDLNNEELARILALIAQEDFGFDVKRLRRGFKLTRWYRFKFRLWRFLYELRHPASDKRQAHKHMIGRVSYGLISVPSGRVAEQTMTKVPGEPVTITAEDGPRNYLPLVDELISCLDQSWPTKPLKIYTSEGITLVTPPRRFFARLRARWSLTWRFDHFATLRNWREGSNSEPSEYLQEVAKLGFSFAMHGYTQASSTNAYPVHSSVSRFLPVWTLPSLAIVWSDVKDYFASVYANSLAQLWVFMAGLFAIFVGRHAIANHSMNRARAVIPLSVGGWGTRGKSGTERLKAAVFNGLGLKVISKTTGCEAMFLEGGAHQPLRELFLFRPYDKATIWEQVNLMKIAARLNADVFLWECMGLTPAYVHILQRHWMRDDIATITNTYPDHEDVQGPAGIDIPIVMREFIPRNSSLVASEEIMLPILKSECDELSTECHAVSWRDTMTVTDDILNRFPYEEHQNNIALVSRMCEQLGIPRHFALKSMADHVVLDLGVLKTYPRSNIDNRTLEYVMGNSANERLGAMGNWRRMGFESHTLENDPDIWVSTIVNNRADRIPRSKVFASMLVNDISADAHAIIGTNVDGFETFLHEAWAEKYDSYSIWQSDLEEARGRCFKIAQRVRIATDPSQIQARLISMCEGLGGSNLESAVSIESLPTLEKLSLPQESEHHLDRIKQLAKQWFDEYRAFAEIVNSLGSAPQAESNQQLLELAKHAFFKRVHCYLDSSVSGEEIISEIVLNTPPGLTNRIMGMQNIKGTGLDFVYRWQAWERCYNACQELESEDEAIRQRGLKELRSFEEYGQLSRQYIKNKVQYFRAMPPFQTESAQADLTEIEKKIGSKDRNTFESKKMKSRLDHPIVRKLITFAERFLDLGDAVRRRKEADKIYQDLMNYRISRARATVELQALTKRQKGNWLYKKLTEQLIP